MTHQWNLPYQQSGTSERSSTPTYMAFGPSTGSQVYLQHTNPLPMPCMSSANRSGSEERVEAGREEKLWNKDEVLCLIFLQRGKMILKTQE